MESNDDGKENDHWLAQWTRCIASRGDGPAAESDVTMHAVGICSAVLLLVGRFAFASDAMMYCGGGLLITASIWNSWPRKQAAPNVVELEFPCDSIPQTKEN